MSNDAMQAALPQIGILLALLNPFSKANVKTATRQLLVALVFYVIGWVTMYYSLHISYILTLLLAVPTAGFLMRIFIFFHDCGHGSFFPSSHLAGCNARAASGPPSARCHDHFLYFLAAASSAS